jgi:hypothetical protein
MFDFLLGGFLALLISIVLHEYGHLEIMRKHGKNPKLRLEGASIVVGEPKDYAGLSNKQLDQVYSAGVIIGTLPYIIAALLIHINLFALIAIYFIWCRSDIKQILKLRK